MSTPIIVDIPHQLGAAEARRRIEEGFAKFATEVGGSMAAHVQHEWAANQMAFSFGTLGQLITGRLEVQDSMVRVEILLPGILGVMTGAIRGKLEKQGRLLLARR